MKKALSLIRRSLYMDFKYILSDGDLLSKLDFIIKKYFLLIKHFIVPFKVSESRIKLFGKDYYYESNLGLVEYHVSLIHHRGLIRDLDINGDNAVLFDVGANVGCFSLVFKDVFPESSVFSFEPVPTVFECLRNNLSDLKSVRVEELGLSDRPGVFKFEYNPINTEMGKISDEGNISVNIDTLDNYIKNNNISHIDMLKIDVETFEKNVLDGAKDSLNMVKYMLMEVNFEDENANYTVPDLMSRLVSEKYDFQLLSIVNFLDRDISSSKVLDFLFVNKKYEER
jgi:FkbM family methyltransferase